MYTTYAKLLSALLIIIYYYKKTKDKLSVWIISYVIFLITSAIIFRRLYPNIPFVSPTIEYMIFLAIVGIPFLVLVVMIIGEFDKRSKKKAEVDNKDFTVLFQPTKDNIIFWTIVILVNIASFILEKNK